LENIFVFENVADLLNRLDGSKVLLDVKAPELANLCEALNPDVEPKVIVEGK
jgi:hypothetical protein